MVVSPAARAFEPSRAPVPAPDGATHDVVRPRAWAGAHAVAGEYTVADPRVRTLKRIPLGGMLMSCHLA